jgi:hypothetical protein
MNVNSRSGYIFFLDRLDIDRDRLDGYDGSCPATEALKEKNKLLEASLVQEEPNVSWHMAVPQGTLLESQRPWSELNSGCYYTPAREVI